MLLDNIDWQTVVTMENKEVYISLVIMLGLLQGYIFWRTR
jgi:hypothetical protein